MLPLVAGVLAAFASGATGAGSATARLQLDGVPFRPETALTGNRRGVGLMHRDPAPRDGMLFVFPYDTTGGFWMKNTLVPLTIAFFDAEGRRVRKLRMTPCREDPCRTYEPGRTYRFALELPASDKRPAAILGPRSSLRRLAALAR